jgi:uncharacterized protein
MSTKVLLNNAMQDAMRSGDTLKKNTLRMALAAIKQNEIDKQIQLDESGLASILQKEVKSRRESILDAQKANRPEIVESLEKEIAILETFLPQQMSKDELKGIIDAAVTESGAETLADMGKVMKLLIPKIQGRAPGDLVSAAVREALTRN